MATKKRWRKIALALKMMSIFETGYRRFVEEAVRNVEETIKIV